jgi:hypothetical protein
MDKILMVTEQRVCLLNKLISFAFYFLLTMKPYTGYATIDESQLMVTWETAGAFTTPSTMLTTIPEMTLYGDGRFIFVDEDRSGNRTLKITQLSTREREEIALFLNSFLERTDIPDFWKPPTEVTDMPTTTIRVHTNGRSKVIKAYALSIYLEKDGSLRRLSGETISIPEPLRKLYERLVQLVSKDAVLYEPKTIQLYLHQIEESYIRNYEKQNIIDWSCNVSLELIFTHSAIDKSVLLEPEYRVITMEGSKMEIVLSYLKNKTPFSKKTSDMIFKANGDYYEVFYRPSLPHETEKLGPPKSKS